MKRILILFAALMLLFITSGCAPREQTVDIAATTLPVYEFTARLCEGTDLTVGRMITQSVSCLHDYSLNVRQVRAAESADLIVISGAGLEEFMHDLLLNRNVLDSSTGIELIECTEPHEHDHGHHHHDADSHIWLSPENAQRMAANICAGLVSRYPGYADIFDRNLEVLLEDINALQLYGNQTLEELSCRELVTFHDGFSYFAQAFDLTILKAVEEESGSEASASELKELILLVQDRQLPAIFTEVNGSSSAASVIVQQTGIQTYCLDMAMSGDSWFEAMYRNIDTIKEALE